LATQKERHLALVLGATGGIGHALVEALVDRKMEWGIDAVIGLSRSSQPAFDLMNEASIAQCAEWVQQQGRPHWVIDATGGLHSPGHQPEKALSQIDPDHMIHSFTINAVGPALFMKHFLPLLPKSGPSVFATLSAKVGSIEDNHLGGWYSYRASKAALNQLVKTASIELKRRAPLAICVALHPGTVDTGLSTPYSKAGLNVRPPPVAAQDLLNVIAQLKPDHTGGFFDYQGHVIPW